MPCILSNFKIEFKVWNWKNNYNEKNVTKKKWWPKLKENFNED
jgi:hypothetical protein